MSAWRVSQGTQVNHEGTVYVAAELLPALPVEVAEKWQTAGYIEPVPTKQTGRRASTA